MATSCLRQVSASSVGIRSLIFPSAKTPAGHVRMTHGFLGASVEMKKSSHISATRRTRSLVLCETAATSVSETEADGEVVASGDEETIVVEVEEVEQEEVEEQSKTGKARKTKGLKNIMQILHQRAVASANEGKDIPNLRTGDIVQLRVEVPENKKRVSLLRGIVIAVHSAGIHTTFRIRRVMAGVGVEMVIPLYSPNIKDIKVVNSRKVRRAKLYYLRDKLARLSTV